MCCVCLLGTKEEDDAEEDDEENYPVEDYDYGDYETATITSDTDLIAGGSLPIFLAEPVDTFVVKGKPATLHCRAAHALQVHIYCNNLYMLFVSLFDTLYEDLFRVVYPLITITLLITVTLLYEYMEVSFPRLSHIPPLELSTKCLCLYLLLGSSFARSSLLVLITYLAAI